MSRPGLLLLTAPSFAGLGNPDAFMAPAISPGSTGQCDAIPTRRLSAAEVGAVVEYLLAA